MLSVFTSSKDRRIYKAIRYLRIGHRLSLLRKLILKTEGDMYVMVVGNLNTVDQPIYQLRRQIVIAFQHMQSK